MKSSKKLNFEELKVAIFEQNGADKRNKDRLFKFAKANNDIETIEKLRDEFEFKGAKIYLDKLEHSSLENAVSNRDIELLKKMIDKGSNVSAINIAELVKRNYTLDFIETLIDNNVDINARATTSIGELGFTALHVASEKRNNIELVKLLISKGADLNSLNQLKATALITASYWGNLEIVKLLCKEENIKLDIKDAEGATALFIAIQHKHVEIVDILLNYNADVNLVLNTGGSALIVAVVNNDYLMVEKILQNHADIHWKFSGKNFPYYNYTALDIAYEEKKMKLSKLISEGKIYIYKDDNGKERLKGHLSSLGLLMEYDDIIELLEDKYLTSSLFIDECFKTVNLTITSPFIAERFVLEELDSARGGNEEAKKWRKECGYEEYEYVGTLSKSFPEVDGGEGPQQTLTRIIFPYFVQDMTNENRHALVAYVRRKVIDKVMKFYSLGKYKEKIKRIQLTNFNTIDVYNSCLVFDNNKYEPLSNDKYVNAPLQRYIEIKNKVVVFSYVNYDNKTEENIFQIKSMQDLYLFDIRKDKNHAPQELVKKLKKFSSDERLKYTNHPLDENLSYDTFIQDLNNGFAEISDDLKILSDSLYKSIISLLFSTEAIQGWSSLAIKNEFKQGNLNSDLINGVQEEIKRLIVVKPNDKKLSLLKRLIEIRKELKEEENFEIKIDLNSLKEISIDKFFTDTQRFEQAIKIIFKDINENSKDSTKKVIVEADKISIDKVNMIEIRIIHIDSESLTNSENLKKAITKNGGNFKSIYNNLLSVCDWSIDTVCSDGRYRIDYLYPQIDNNKPHCTPIKDTIRSFTHILRFYI